MSWTAPVWVGSFGSKPVLDEQSARLFLQYHEDQVKTATETLRQAVAAQREFLDRLKAAGLSHLVTESGT